MAYSTLLTAIAVAFGLLWWLPPWRKLLLPLFEDSSQVKLDFSPADLTKLDVISVIISLLGRSILQKLGFGQTIRLGKDGKSAYFHPRLAPAEISMPLKITQHDVDLYHAAVGAPSSLNIVNHAGHLSLFLSAVSEPAMLLLLAKRGSCINPLGAVNVRNRIELLRPDILAKIGLPNLLHGSLSASTIPEMHSVNRGWEISLQVRLSLSDEKEGAIDVFRQLFTLLQFAKTEVVTQNASAQREDEGFQTDGVEMMEISANDPSKWAAICKDYNPIHTSNIAARLFGFRRKIAHGNHVLAKAFEVMRVSSPENKGSRDQTAAPISLKVSFVRPILVPASGEVRYLRAPNSTKLNIYQQKLSIAAQLVLL